MEKYTRKALTTVLERLQVNPVVALLGPRQCGKTTLSKLVASQFQEVVTLDLEKRLDLELLEEPELFLERHTGKLIIIDEIQLRPDLFSVLRTHVDSVERECKILILGSASRALIKQGSESLAGRISFVELTPFLLSETPGAKVEKQWERGGFPLSYLAKNERHAELWREDYLRSLVERDLPMLGLNEPPLLLKRFLSMLAHFHGEVVNAAKLSDSLGIATTKIPHYLAFLEGAYIIRKLQPYYSNLKKRLVKSPKIYYRDCGLFQSILGVENFEQLMRNPAFGNSWEGLVIEQVISSIDTSWTPFFYRTQVGAEIDLIVERNDVRIAIECKASKAPKVSKGFWSSLEDLEIQPENAWIICPIDEVIPFKKGSTIAGINQIIQHINAL